MGASTWAFAAEKLLNSEGGYWNDPVGGPTKYGVTLTTLRNYAALAGFSPSAAITTQSVMNLTLDQARAIWKAGYWDRAYCDQLPAGLDYAVFDIAINSGPQRGVKLLQEALGLSGGEVDGIFGPRTRAAAATCDVRAVLAKLALARMQFMVTLKNWKPNSAGWALRVVEVNEGALSIMQSSSVTIP